MKAARECDYLLDVVGVRLAVGAPDGQIRSRLIAKC